jgi:hypothetical protein
MLQEDRGAGIECRSRCENIIHEEQVHSGHSGILTQGEGVPQVLPATLAAEAGLRVRVTRAKEALEDGDSAENREMLGKDGGLVELALAQTAWVEWNGNQGVQGAVCQTGIGKAFALDAGKHAAKPHFAAIFQAMNKIANRALAPHDGDRILKGKLRFAAIRTDKFRRNRPLEWLRARFAAGFANALDHLGTIPAEVHAALDPAGTVGAVRREEQRANRLKKGFERDGHGEDRKPKQLR